MGYVCVWCQTSEIHYHYIQYLILDPQKYDYWTLERNCLELLALSGERTSERERDMKISYFSRQGVWVGPDMAGLVYAELDLVLQSIFSFYLRMQVLSSSFSDCICLYASCWITGFLFMLTNWSWIFMEIITWGTCQINHLGQKTSCFEVPGFVNLQSTDKVWLNFDQHSYNFVHLFSTIYTFFSIHKVRLQIYILLREKKVTTTIIHNQQA